jgi:hypothetical protein
MRTKADADLDLIAAAWRELGFEAPQEWAPMHGGAIGPITVAHWASRGRPVLRVWASCGERGTHLWRSTVRESVAEAVAWLQAGEL